jgi:AcrR family transcriptional regulator
MSTERPGPRERLLRAARELTYTQGVGVGVDAILKEADVARRSLYQHFGGKDGLLTEVIRSTTVEDEQAYRDALAAGGTDPRARLRNVFSSLEKTISSPGFRGCRYIAADLALIDPAHPVHAEIRAYRHRLHDLLEKELTDMAHPAPGEAAEELAFIIDGALVAGATRPDTDPARTARIMADRVLDTC